MAACYEHRGVTYMAPYRRKNRGVTYMAPYHRTNRGVTFSATTQQRGMARVASHIR